MDFLPLGLKLAGHTVVVVGGGDTALRKARLLHRAGARLRLVAPQWRAELQGLVEREGAGGECHRRAFQDDDLDGARLVVLATDDGALNERVAALCAARGVPVNVVDRPDISSFVFPALIDRDPLFITISSSGVSPVLTRRLRARLEAWLPSRWGRLAGILGRFRAPLARALPDRKAREAFWERQLDGPLVEQVLSGHESEAEAALHAAVAHADQERPPPVDGEVYLVGAGPGDPDLLTFRGLHLLRKADTVLYDRLVAPEILALAREDAELIYVGKARDRHTLPQDNINDLLVHYAREGKKVCRLKGGDPFIFGRGGEELIDLARAGIATRVIPGITAGSGCATYADIPLTHRGVAASVQFLTAYGRDGELDHDWTSLVRGGHTLVVYMGVMALENLCPALTRHGMQRDTPAALIERGTTPEQRVLTGTVSTLPGIAARHTVTPPAVLIVGDVVNLRGVIGQARLIESADQTARAPGSPRAYGI